MHGETVKFPFTTYHTSGVRGLSSTFWSGTCPSSHGRVYGNWSL